MSKRRTVGLIVMAIGGCLIYYGLLEYRVGSGASPDPADVELADLEAGKPLPDNHIRIGLHHCLYKSSVIEYEYDEDDGKAMKPSSPVKWIWSPLISDRHPYMQKLRKLVAKHGSIKKIPRNADWPVVKDFVVLLKSEAYDTVREIPDGRKLYKSVSGLVINRIESLGDDEKRLIRRRFPEIDFDKILIVEHGRKPSSPAVSVAFIAGGTLLVLMPVAFFVRRLVGRPPAAGSPGPVQPAPDAQAEDGPVKA